MRIATNVEILAAIAKTGKQVLTFVGYSGAGYEDVNALEKAARAVLAEQNPAQVLVSCGATQMGIGAVYLWAKQTGFDTIGIVSTRLGARQDLLSPYVDEVFYVKDERWGGFLPGTTALSPVSAAIVETSTWMVGIGGGMVARDELLAARARGIPVQFFAADQHHALARQHAAQQRLPAPTHFRGAAGWIFTTYAVKPDADGK